MLVLHKDVRLDLDAIKNESQEVFAKIAALVRQLQQDPNLAEKLLDHGYGDDRAEEFSVNKWLNLWRQNKDFWRLKDWDLEDMGLKYRIIYLYLRHEARFVIMAIVKREEIDYDDENNSIRQRVLASARSTYGIQ